MKKYQARFAECPYLSTHGNLCSHKKNGKYCGYKQPKNCQYYNEVIELRKMQENGCKDFSELSEEGDEDETK